MPSKNIIIGIVVAFLLGGGTIFYILGDNNTGSNTPSPIARKGELTRELARQVVMDYYEKNQLAASAIISRAIYNQNAKAYSIGDINDVQEQQLVNAGLIKPLSLRSYGGSHFFTFTDAALPYLSTPTESWANKDDKLVKLGEFKNTSFMVTGITMQGETNAIVQITVETDYNYNTPFGSVLKKENPPQVSGAIPLILYDDGWRVQLGQ
jgi:hypothetical protein